MFSQVSQCQNRGKSELVNNALKGDITSWDPTTTERLSLFPLTASFLLLYAGGYPLFISLSGWMMAE